jgi:putative transposase
MVCRTRWRAVRWAVPQAGCTNGCIRPPTPRQQHRVELAERIGKSFIDSGATYGSPRVVLDLRAEGRRVSVNTVAMIMRRECLVARPRRRRHGLTRPGKRCAASDLVRRNFNAVAPNVLWCGDLTEIATSEGETVSGMCAGYVLPQRFGPRVQRTPRRATGRRRRPQQQTTQNPRLEDTSRSPRRTDTITATSRWCDDRLNPVNTAPRPSLPPALASGLPSPWAASDRPWTTPPASHSTPRSKSSTSTGGPSPPWPRPSGTSQPGSPASTT